MKLNLSQRKKEVGSWKNSSDYDDNDYINIIIIIIIIIGKIHTYIS